LHVLAGGFAAAAGVRQGIKDGAEFVIPTMR